MVCRACGSSWSTRAKPHTVIACTHLFEASAGPGSGPLLTKVYLRLRPGFIGKVDLGS
jgi:hypothetical protein